MGRAHDGPTEAVTVAASDASTGNRASMGGQSRGGGSGDGGGEQQRQQQPPPQQQQPQQRQQVARRVVVGLGNPGMEYLRARHNIGFMVVDTILLCLRPPTSGGVTLDLLATRKRKVDDGENCGRGGGDHHKGDGSTSSTSSTSSSSSFSRRSRSGGSSSGAVKFHYDAGLTGEVAQFDLHFSQSPPPSNHHDPDAPPLPLPVLDLFDRSSPRAQAMTARHGVEFPHVKLTLLKPLTLMNECGESVKALLDGRATTLAPDVSGDGHDNSSLGGASGLLLVVDDMAVPLGRFKLSRRTVLTQKGVLSVLAHLPAER
jgi:peptidyl-tRNA hydrolase